MSEAGIINDVILEKALESNSSDWLRDKRGWYRIKMTADEVHGDLPTEYWFSICEEWYADVIRDAPRYVENSASTTIR